MRAAIVGNGPSALDKGAEIDACEYVVRCNAGFAYHAGRSGRRTTHWAWMGDSYTWDEIGKGAYPLLGEYEVWATLPMSRCNPPHGEHAGNVLRVLAASDMRRVRHVSEAFWDAEQRALTAVAGGEWHAPSTGLTALHLALAFLPELTEITLYGFDATHPDEPGWGDALRKVSWTADANKGHSFRHEKWLIDHLCETGDFLGRHYDFPVRRIMYVPPPPPVPQEVAGG